MASEKTKTDRRYLWWSLATLAGAVVMALGLTRSADPDAVVSVSQSALLMIAVICLPFALAAMIAGLAMTSARKTRPVASQLLGYGLVLTMVVLWIAIVVGSQ